MNTSDIDMESDLPFIDSNKNSEGVSVNLTSRSKPGEQNKGSSITDIRRVVTPKRTNLKRVSSSAQHEKKGAKKLSVETLDPRHSLTIPSYDTECRHL
ncbi:trna-specific adenosine deaminase [Lasius niger]|uniref:Trna-specific adenosine deaminase n=1 Tax=Lasius niger TaxID=67767 RepID=A0A0J7K604_LASNI|nr:trna-specific adenosine deaminase [Lasius niger]